MIIGNGLMASVFIQDYKDNENFIIFASGVSNSSETNLEEFLKEKNLLIKTLHENPLKQIIYFTSFIDTNISKIKYANHKKEMEEIISSSQNNYMILKLPQVIGNGGNKNTLINFIVNKLYNNEEILVYKNTYKSLIDVDDVKRITDVLLKAHTNKMHIEFPYIEKLLVRQIVNLVAKQLKIEPKIKFIDSDFYDLPDLSLVNQLILFQLNINAEGYTEKVIKKYIK
jgi:hypothetical protein